MMPCLHDDKTHFRSLDLPAAHYTDLSRSDITVLTEILTHAPDPSKPMYRASYEEIVKSQIAKLPYNLVSKLPWLSTFCTLHHKIIPLPVVGLLKALQYEVNVAAEEVWAPLLEKCVLNVEQNHMLNTLEDLGILWLKPDEFQAKYHRPPKDDHRKEMLSKCGACTLASIGGDRNAMIALGAFFIGRSAPSIWKKSKRLLWMEAWIRNSLEDSEQEDAVVEMWQLGRELRKVRKEYGGGGRDYVDGAVEQALAGERMSEHHYFEAEVNESGGWHEELTANEVFDIPANPFDDGEEGEDLISVHGGSGGYVDKNIRLPYAASSIYSRNPDEPSGSHEVGSSKYRDVESELLSLYQYSRPRESRGVG